MASLKQTTRDTEMFKYIENNWHKFTPLDGDLAAKAISEISDIEKNFSHLKNFSLADFARLCDEVLCKAKSSQADREDKRSINL